MFSLFVNHLDKIIVKDKIDHRLLLIWQSILIDQSNYQIIDQNLQSITNHSQNKQHAEWTYLTYIKAKASKQSRKEKESKLKSFLAVKTGKMVLGLLCL